MQTPLVTDPKVARELAEGEYMIRRSDGCSYWLCCSMGADGGMHYRKTVARREQAERWMAEKVDALVERILSGRCDGTTLFAGSDGRPYLA